MAGFRRILVPLDGSRLAEAVLPSAVGFAIRLDSTLILLHLLERNAPRTVHGEPHLTSPAEAELYLARVADRCRAEGGSAVEVHLHPEPVEDVAESIAAHARELDADLIALSTHGSGGVRDLLIGSIAEQALHRGQTSLLLVRPGGGGEALPFSCGIVAVALDPTSHGFAPLSAALLLARACEARLHLITVVPTPATLPGERRATATFSPGAIRLVLELERRDTEELLREIAGSPEARGLVVGTEVRLGDPVAEVLEAVGERRADLLVVATHGRAGLAGLLAGSFGSRVMSHSPVPVLLVRIAEPGGDASAQDSRPSQKW